MDIIGEMHDFDFVAFIQRQPELVFAEQRFCFHCLFAFVADCLYRLHICYGTLAVRATQVKPVPWQLSKRQSAALGRVFCSPDKPPSCVIAVSSEIYPYPTSYASTHPWRLATILRMRLSARNRLVGKIVELQLGDIMAHVVVEIGDNQVESVITRRSAEELKLKVGDTVAAVIKSTEVMLQKA